ncbi:hypothetical protein RSOLAG1IB_11706 [Rhizoctonia solani AG-1 IB]|uniref:AAA+ ATPase domain-containing protein n=1 Tax=Thanatephorus cucumeris (strain AG1-IB / isolate 7/3/14) TaxID=1108050 RepID=A0A0B7FEJ8_THACB|nr:hypothetical protein RSOLAG1IB_11706 [Rhizoctonia solani AG-1 IB]
MPLVSRGEDITSRSYFTCFNQVWDKHTYENWAATSPINQTVNLDRGLIFKAYNRVYGPLGSSIDDHTWIELVSDDLVKFLRTHQTLKGVKTLENSRPGIDARDVFLRLETLEVSAVEPIFEQEQEESEVVAEGEPAPPPEPVLPFHFTTFEEAQFPSPPRSPVILPAPLSPLVPPSPQTSFYYHPIFVDNKPQLTVSEQLWILLDFVESHFKETIEELKRLKLDGYISYKLLWTICAPGDIVGTKDAATGFPVGLRVESWDYGCKGTKFTIRGVTYAWDGKCFKDKIVPVEIKRFEGLMRIDQIPIELMADQSKNALIERGRIYQKYAGVHHLKYDGFITVSTGRSTVKLPAKGRVMVDTEGYSRYNPNAPCECQTTAWNPYPIGSPSQPCFLPPQQDMALHQEYGNETPMPDEILCLTPPTHKAWSFTAETWGDVLVENLSEIRFNEFALDQLVIKTEQKTMIRALVKTFSESGSNLLTDKGGGATIVLDGDPGTGKMLTAEALSEHLKCPLYVISSGELRTQAQELEKQLHNIREMAAAWKAIVLINEANILLETRNTYDIMRNSLVGVFLRELKYHTGVVILSTNKIRSFDKVFIPRISIAIHYPDLDESSRLLIWKQLLVRAGVNLADSSTPLSGDSSYITHDELTSLAKKPVDACVIEQIIRGAQALSVADKEPLCVLHVRAALEINEQFEVDRKENGMC